MKRTWIAVVPMLAAVAVAVLLTVGGTADASVTPSICRLDVKATVVNKVGPCPEGARVATYEYAPGALPGPFGPETFPQTLFDVGDSQAMLPPCAWQADLFTGDVLTVVDGSHLLGDRRIDAAYGGTMACGGTTTTSTSTTTSTTQPTTTSTSTSTTTSTTATTQPSTTTSTSTTPSTTQFSTTTTSTTGTTLPSTTTAPSTTLPGSTTTAPGPTFPTTSTPPTFGKCDDDACNVGSTFTVPPTTTATTALARTGAGVGWLVALAVGVLILGVVLVAAARNRRTQ